MKVIDASFEILDDLNYSEILKKIELCGRVCYKSEFNIKNEYSAEVFTKRLMSASHESVIEHFSFSVRFIVDRGVSHEIVRHRHASFSQESTRYCNYGSDRFENDVTFIRPYYIRQFSSVGQEWEEVMLQAEEAYFYMLDEDETPQNARCVLPNSLKTEIIMTANLREWRHFFKLRTSTRAHPQMREVTIPLLEELKERLPVFFQDID